jgi:glycosyltransferase involved in cell wall biosynthesis
MTILYVSREFAPSNRTGGIGVVVRDLALGMLQLGHKVIVLSASDKWFDEKVYCDEGVIIYRLGFTDFFIGKSIVSRVINWLFSKLFYDVFRYRIYRKIVELDKLYNFCLVEFADYGNEGKYWFKRKFIPTVIRYHGPLCLNLVTQKIELNTTRKKDEYRSFQFADGHIFVSSLLRDIISYTSKSFFDNRKVKVIYNGVDACAVLSQNFYVSSQTFQSQREFSILSAGTISRYKGIHLLIEACEILISRGYIITLDLFGRPGGLEKYIKKKINKNPDTKRWLKVNASISRSSLLGLYNKYDLCCFPSFFETFGLAIAEAMGQGSVVLATNRGGTVEYLVDNVNGFLTDPFEGAFSLANAIEKIINLGKLNSDLVRIRANQTIKSSFAKLEMVKESELFYLSLI